MYRDKKQVPRIIVRTCFWTWCNIEELGILLFCLILEHFKAYCSWWSRIRNGMCDFNACGNRNWDGFHSRRIFCILLSTNYHAVPEIWHVNPSRCLQKLSFDGSFRESLCLGIPHYSQMYHKHVDLLPTWLISLQFGGTNVVFILVGSRTPPSDGPVWTRDDNRISLMANVVVLQEVIRFSSRVRCYELFMQFMHTL